MVSVWPSDVRGWVVPGVSVTVAAAFATVTGIEALIAALLGFAARTFVVPGAFAVTVPSDVTRAMSGSSLVHVAAVEGSVAPTAFLSVAASVLKSFTDASVMLASVMSINVGRLV